MMYILMALLGSASPAAAPAAPAQDDFIRASFKWQDCVMDNARRWAETDEDIGLITKTAISSCVTEWQLMRVATIRSVNREGKKAKDVMAEANAWLEGSEEGTRKAIVRMILDKRAARKSSGATGTE